MKTWQLIAPDLILSAPITAITPQLMQKHNLRGLILDVDNTIIGDDEADPSPEVYLWAQSMRSQYPIWLASNNFSDRRIQKVAETLQLPYRSRAGKPSRRVVRQVLEAIQLPAEQVAMVGDRLFTDTIVGNRLGLFTILVQPPCNEQIILKPSLNTIFKARSTFLRNWEIWIARKSGIEI
ncbi:MAG: YqeG family HAD IIIA-type phosphatase [Pseudanabaenaceae cyanobacterium bins.39]|nr:YqeG family HAD IIIA-type phosphatase [Pseudanabaenaceae cyanobacterium bins.39]